MVDPKEAATRYANGRWAPDAPKKRENSFNDFWAGAEWALKAIALDDTALNALADKIVARKNTPGKLAPSDSPGTGSGEGSGPSSLPPCDLCKGKGGWTFAGPCPRCTRTGLEREE